MPRVSRTAATLADRRRRKTENIDRIGEDKLGVPSQWYDEGGVLDRTKWQARWINDSGNRIHNLTVSDDYDIVKVETEGSKEEAIRRPVGQKETGEPLYAYLCRKPLEFWQEDQKAKIAVIDGEEKALLSNPTPAQEDNRTAQTAYVAPNTSIKHGYSP